MTLMIRGLRVLKSDAPAFGGRAVFAAADCRAKRAMKSPERHIGIRGVFSQFIPAAMPVKAVKPRLQNWLFGRNVFSAFFLPVVSFLREGERIRKRQRFRKKKRLRKRGRKKLHFLFPEDPFRRSTLKENAVPEPEVSRI